MQATAASGRVQVTAARVQSGLLGSAVASSVASPEREKLDYGIHVSWDLAAAVAAR